jgi:hypothetical protein
MRAGLAAVGEGRVAGRLGYFVQIADDPCRAKTISENVVWNIAATESAAFQRGNLYW